MPEIRTAETVLIPTAGVRLTADISVPSRVRGVVLFAHGTGSSRHSPRNRAVAETLTERGHATVLTDLLTADEERADLVTGHLRFDIGMLADRLVGIVDWLDTYPVTSGLPTGLFGASTGAAAALVAAAARPQVVKAVVSRGGRPDLAGPALAEVRAPTLLLVGERDAPVVDLNLEAAQQLSFCEVRIIPRATHLFEEPGALEEVARQAADWFDQYLTSANAAAA